MKISFFVGLLLITFNGISQSISIKLPVLSLVDEVSFPTIQGGIEFKLSKKIGWYNEVGIKYRKSYYEKTDTGFVKPKGFKFKSELRYYPMKPDVYIAMNGFYTKDLHNTAVTYYHNGDSSDRRVDNFSAKKTVRSLNVIAGKIYPIRERFKIEIYSGIGVRFLSIESDNKEVDAERDILRRSPDWNIPDNRIRMDVEGGKTILPNFLLGMRFSYSFK